MQKLICIPEERYYQMLKTYDEMLDELHEIRKALAEAPTSTKASNPTT